MSYFFKKIDNNFIVSFVIVISFSIIPEHYKWFDIGILKIIILSLFLYPFILAAGAFSKDIVEYGDIRLAKDSFYNAFNIFFIKLFKYGKKIRDEKFKEHLKDLWKKKNVTLDQLSNYVLLKEMILFVIEYDNVLGKQRIYNAFGTSINNMKSNQYLLDIKTKEKLSDLYDLYISMNINYSWEDIYYFSNYFIDVLNLYINDFKSNQSYNKNNYQKTYKNVRGNKNNNIYDKHYEILNVSSSASLSEIKTAYRKLMQINHPDKFVNADEETKMKANEMSKKINDSYSFLKNVLE